MRRLFDRLPKFGASLLAGGVVALALGFAFSSVWVGVGVGIAAAVALVWEETMH